MTDPVLNRLDMSKSRVLALCCAVLLGAPRLVVSAQQCDAALFGKFHGIGQQVVYNLTQSCGVSDDMRIQWWTGINDQTQAFFHSLT